VWKKNQIIQNISITYPKIEKIDEEWTLKEGVSWSGFYTGIFVLHQPHGNGTFVEQNKYFVYQGEWKNGFRHGKGCQTFFDGSNYVGQWKKGLRHGYGTATWTDDMKYEGEWMSDKFTVGNLTIRYGKEDEIRYEGRFDTFRSTGRLIYGNGDIYSGEVNLSLLYSSSDPPIRSGYGIMVFNNGSVQRGLWTNDQLIKEVQDFKLPFLNE